MSIITHPYWRHSFLVAVNSQCCCVVDRDTRCGEADTDRRAARVAAGLCGVGTQTLAGQLLQPDQTAAL